MKSILKTISWLLVSGLIIFVGGYFETGNALIAVKAAFWASVLKTPVYWIHEVVWTRAGVTDPVVIDGE